MRALRIAVLVAAGWITAMFVYVVGARIGYPYELEWMCGSVLDHIARVRAGLPVYTAPTTAWIPFLYPPLFYWIAAPLGGSFFACRMVSLVATLVQAACIWRLARASRASRYWSTVGVLLFFACYFYVGYWYDIERSDTLSAALVLVAATFAIERPSLAGAVGAGAILGVAFFAKQQALPFAAAASVALAIDRAWKRGVALSATAGAIVLIGTLLENRATDGWFGYYIFKMPTSHGIDLRLWRDVWDYDLPRGPVLVVATCAFCGMAAKSALRGDRRDVFLGCMVAAGAVTSLTSRLHIGGWINVLQFWTSFACAGFAALGARIEAWLEGKSFAIAGDAAVSVLLLAQLALWVHSPAERVPDVTIRADTERFLRNVRRLERGGEVLVVGRGHVTKTPHFQMSALADVNRVSGLPRDILDALRERRLSAIVDDARLEDSPPLGLWPPIMLEDIPEARALLFADYYVAESFDDESLRLPMPAPAVPRWAYRPRREPLTLPESEITRLHYAEMKLAVRRSEAMRAGDRAPFDENEIEELAARAVAASR
jgi:Dolichyl-phosphate-mannose-protein mannosyltransferase